MSCGYAITSMRSFNMKEIHNLGKFKPDFVVYRVAYRTKT